MENTASKIEQLTDQAFGIAILVFFVGCIGSFFYSLYALAPVPGVGSVGGILGVGYGYMKWNVIRRAKIKNTSVTEVADLIKSETDSNE